MSVPASLKVLVVEDEAPQREMLMYNLNSAGYRALDACDLSLIHI